MEKNQENLVQWSKNKALEYLESAKTNLNDERFYPAAEEIFRAVETSLETMLYAKGIKEIRYPGKEKEFKGRLALKFLVRDNRVITQKEYDEYVEIERKLHSAGYIHGEKFNKKELEKYLEFAEDIFFKI